MDLLLPTVAALILGLAVAVGWGLTLLGLPGTWLTVASVAIYSWLGPADGRLDIGWSATASLAGLAGLGEVLESALGMWTAKRAGGSRRAGWYSLAGSLIGSIAGAAVGVPLPLVGSMIGALSGGAMGALGGAVVAEYSLGQDDGTAWRVGQAAFWGRLLGAFGKIVVATCMVVGVVCALCW